MNTDLSPISTFSDCEECGAKIGEECNDCANHSSRIHYFIENAPLDLPLKAQSWSFNGFPDHLKKMCLEDNDSIFLNEEEYMVWKSTL
jgi:hypothetical protein